MVPQRFIAALTAACAWACVAFAEPDLSQLRFAPLLDYQETEDANGESYAFWRALGPFLSRGEPEWGTGRRVSAVPRPLLVHFTEPQADEWGMDSFWPLAVHRNFDSGHRTRFVLVYYAWKVLAGEDEPTMRWGLFPVVSGGRVPDNGEYFALFPLGGVVHNVAGYDHVRFFLFPLYFSTIRSEHKQYSVLWPIFSITKDGDELRKWRVFPLVGGSRGPHRRQIFALWPLVHWMKADPPDAGKHSAFAFLPFYGQITETNEEGEQTYWSRTVLWPFFSMASGQGVSKLHILYPFYQYKARREGGALVYKRHYFWPLYGSVNRPNERRRFILWPFYHEWRETAEDGTVKRRRNLVPFYWDFTERDESGIVEKYRHVWPLFRHERIGERRCLSVLSLWPYRRLGAVRRNYKPLWTLYRREDGARGMKEEAFWGLWQRSRSTKGEEKTARWHLFPLLDVNREGDAVSVGFLKGLLKIDTDPAEKNRFLWFLKW